MSIAYFSIRLLEAVGYIASSCLPVVLNWHSLQDCTYSLTSLKQPCQKYRCDTLWYVLSRPLCPLLSWISRRTWARIVSLSITSFTGMPFVGSRHSFRPWIPCLSASLLNFRNSERLISFGFFSVVKYIAILIECSPYSVLEIGVSYSCSSLELPCKSLAGSCSFSLLALSFIS